MCKKSHVIWMIIHGVMDFLSGEEIKNDEAMHEHMSTSWKK
jgi:hypothetical protein